MNNKKRLSGTEARLREVRAGPSPSRMQTFVKCPLGHQNPILNSPPPPTAWPSGDPSHSELKPKFSLWLYPTATPTAHLPDLISQHSPPPQGLSAALFAFSHPRAPAPAIIFLLIQISGAPTASDPQVSHQTSLKQRNLPWPSHINAQYFIWPCFSCLPLLTTRSIIYIHTSLFKLLVSSTET